MPLRIDGYLNMIPRTEILTKASVFSLGLISFIVLIFGNGMTFLFPFLFLIVVLLFANPTFAITFLLLISPSAAAVSKLLHMALNVKSETALSLSFCMVLVVLPLVIKKFIPIKLSLNTLKISASILLPTTLFLLSFASSKASFLSIFMSGDTRNHTLLIRNIVNEGFVTNAQQAFYPSYYFHIAAVVANGIGLEKPITSTLLGIIIGYVFAILIIVFSISKLMDHFEIPKRYGFLLGLPIATSTVLGFILMHGFYSAAWGLAVVIVSYTFLFNSLSKSRIELILQGAFFALLSYHAWALLVPLVLLPYLAMALRKNLPSRPVPLRLIFMYMSFLAFSYLSVEHQGSVSRVFTLLKTDGGISDISFSTSIAVFIVLFVVLTKLERNSVALSLLTVFILTWSMFITIGILRRTNTTFIGYYNQKLLWIFSAAIIQILVIVTLVLLRRNEKSNFRIFALLTSMILFTVNLTPLQNITLQLQLTNWSGPNPSVSEKVLEMDGNAFMGERVIFWYYSDPGNDRIGTFWASTFSNKIANTLEFNDIAAWAYSQTGQVSDLCSVLSETQQTFIVTSNSPQVLSSVDGLCPAKKLSIKFIQ